MIIRKKYNFNNAHIVRNCSSNRCKNSIHSHTYSIEFYFKSNELDNGSMVIDFGLLKYTFKELIKAFNNSFTIWDKDIYLLEYINDLERYIITPFSPSAEELSRFFLWFGNKIIENTEFNNNEKNPKLIRVRVDETKSGFALAGLEDIIGLNYDLSNFESNICNFNKLKERILHKDKFIMPEVKKQI